MREKKRERERERFHSILSSIAWDEKVSVRERYLVHEMVSTRTGIREEGRKHEESLEEKERIRGRNSRKNLHKKVYYSIGFAAETKFFSEFQVCSCSSSSSRRRSTAFERRERERERERERGWRWGRRVGEGGRRLGGQQDECFDEDGESAPEV
jgi:hypothetical protein